MPSVPPDAVSHVKKGLKGLFSRRKSREQTKQSAPSAPSSATTRPPTNTTAPTAAAAPATAAIASQSVNESIQQDAKEEEVAPPQPAAAPPNEPAADITRAPAAETTTNSATTSTAPDAQDSKPHISAPAEAAESKYGVEETKDGVEEAKAGRLDSIMDPKDGKDTVAPEDKPRGEGMMGTALAGPSAAGTVDTAGMSATSGPMGDELDIGSYGGECFDEAKLVKERTVSKQPESLKVDLSQTEGVKL